MKRRALFIMSLFTLSSAIAYSHAPVKGGADKCRLYHRVEFACCERLGGILWYCSRNAI